MLLFYCIQNKVFAFTGLYESVSVIFSQCIAMHSLLPAQCYMFALLG